RSATAQARPSLKAFFETVLRNPSTLPKFEDLHALAEGIANMRSEEIKTALPALFEALAYQDENVKAYACAALFAIAGRQDGAKLLDNRIEAIGHDLLSSRFPHIEGGEGIILGRLKPPPLEAAHFLLAFISQRDRDPNAQGGAIFELLRTAPQNSELVATIREFLSRPIDSNVRMGVLNALGNPGTTDAQLIALITE